MTSILAFYVNSLEGKKTECWKLQKGRSREETPVNFGGVHHIG